MNKNNLFFRLLASPFILCLMLLQSLRLFILYLRYGGELTTFIEDERPTIYSIYKALKEATEQARNKK